MTEHILGLAVVTRRKARAEGGKKRKIRGVIRAAAPRPCDCVESVNPIRSGALGSGNSSVLRLERVLTDREGWREREPAVECGRSRDKKDFSPRIKVEHQKRAALIWEISVTHRRLPSHAGAATGLRSAASFFFFFFQGPQ